MTDFLSQVEGCENGAASDSAAIMNARPLVSVVLLSFNRPAFLEAALASVIRQSYQNLEIIVVDNPSPASAEVAVAVKHYPQIKLIQTDDNLGYTGGMNTGIAVASGDYVHLTEDDLVLEDDCIQRLVEFMEQTPSADLVAPVIYNKTARTIRCAGGEFSLAPIYTMRIFGWGEPDVGQFPGPFEVKYIDGATMFARKTFWQRHKGFRGEYFMYAESTELCLRAKKAGDRMCIVPQSKIYHFEPVLQHVSPEIEFHKWKNFFSLYLLHAPISVLPEFYCRYAILDILRAMFSGDRQLRPRMRALWWLLKASPGLIRERLYTPSNNSVPKSTPLVGTVPQRS